VICSATDADVCKTYVELGLGIAILVRLCFDPRRDLNLAIRDVGEILPTTTLHIVFRKGGYLSRPLSVFVSKLAPHLSQQGIRRAMEEGRSGAAVVGRRPLPRL
jgi:LysR family cys regulon transcriptional activator